MPSDKKADSGVYKHSFLHQLIYRGQKFDIRGPESESFHRRSFEMPIQTLTHVDMDSLGYTNQVLSQDVNQTQTHLFVPVYVTLKMKSIEKMELVDRSAVVTGVLSIAIMVDGLPSQVREALIDRIPIQINHADGFYLRVNADSIGMRFKEHPQHYQFLLRDKFQVQLHEAIRLSPFEIHYMVLSVTLNSLDVRTAQGHTFRVSFNNMRNPSVIPISYSPNCRFGVYDVAENMLECYPSPNATYHELMDCFRDFVDGEEHCQMKATKNSKVAKEAMEGTKGQLNTFPVQRREPLRMVRGDIGAKGQKLEYFQYAHFVIPVYKMPGNAWSTIFIPVFMLAVLSIAIYFPNSPLQAEVASVATMVLAFIALIPSIKAQLPQTQKMSITEWIVYIEALNCMVSLIDNLVTTRQPKKVWHNKFFLCSLIIHIVCLAIAVGLLLMHKLLWLRQYNRHKPSFFVDPQQNREAWHNPYCDEVFLRYNKTTVPNQRCLPYQSCP